MKAQREVAAQSGKEHVVVTGEKTKVTQSMKNSGSKIERRPDLGPQGRIKVIAQRRSSFRETVEAYAVDGNRGFVTPPPFSPNLRVLRDEAEAEAAERAAPREAG